MDKRDVKGASIKRGTQTVVEDSILVSMMADVSVCNCKVGIRFRLAVRRLRGLSWASIVCGTLSFKKQPTYPLLITLLLR